MNTVSDTSVKDSHRTTCSTDETFSALWPFDSRPDRASIHRYQWRQTQLLLCFSALGRTSSRRRGEGGVRQFQRALRLDDRRSKRPCNEQLKVSGFFAGNWDVKIPGCGFFYNKEINEQLTQRFNLGTMNSSCMVIFFTGPSNLTVVVVKWRIYIFKKI